MSPMQLAAIRRPCQHAEQCADPRYLGPIYGTGDFYVSCILTLNVGRE